jgi:hypothetical protein
VAEILPVPQNERQEGISLGVSAVAVIPAPLFDGWLKGHLSQELKFSNASVCWGIRIEPDNLAATFINFW